MRADASTLPREAPDWLLWRAELSPHSLALKRGARELSYAGLQRSASLLCAGLRSRRVERGERVALLLPASEDYVALVHAIARLGAVVVPLNHRQSVPELLSQLKDARPALVVFEGSVGSRVRDAAKPSRGRWVGVAELIASSRGLSPVVGDRLDLGAPHAIVYTSGSGGSPKGAVLSLSNLLWNSVSLEHSLGTSPRDRWLLCLPLFHVGGYSILYRALLAGSGVVLHPKFDPETVSESLDRDGVTLTSFVPTMLAELIRARERTPFPPRLRRILVGGGKPNPELVADIRRRHLPVTFTYGMTETCSFVALSASRSAELQYHPALPSQVRTTKTSERGRLAGPGEVGELAVRGPTVFSGYWRRPALTRSRLVGGWFLTGDLGVLQRGGGFTVIGRREETIVTGGEKVFPAEVESALRTHPQVAEAVVFGVEDPRWGQMVVAVVEPSDQARRPSEAELDAFLRERLGRYKVPKRYVFRADLPRTSTGKPRRAEIRAELEGGGRAA